MKKFNILVATIIILIVAISFSMGYGVLYNNQSANVEKINFSTNNDLIYHPEFDNSGLLNPLNGSGNQQCEWVLINGVWIYLCD